MNESISSDNSKNIIQQLAEMDRQGIACKSNNIVGSVLDNYYYDRFAVKLEPAEQAEQDNPFGSNITIKTF